MAPAFRTTRQAIAFAILLLGLLALPAVARKLAFISRAKVYPTMPASTGPYAYIQQQIFEEKAGLDIAFIGSSFMLVGVDTPYVQKQLSARLGRPARVITLASDWPGMDRDYCLARDLLEHRKVKMLVINLPVRTMSTDDPDVDVNRVGDRPHVQAPHFFGAGHSPSATVGLPVYGQASAYACEVFGMGRHLLSLLRTNYPAPILESATLGSHRIERGYFLTPFQRFTPPVPALAPESLIYSPAASGNFRFFNEPLNAFQLHFIKLIGGLAKQHGAKLVVLHVPLACERKATAVEERMPWPDVLGSDAVLAGVAPHELFAGLTDEEIKRLYYSDHLNANGMELFTQTVTPALLEVYAQIKP